jgi:hypothetical protein
MESDLQTANSNIICRLVHPRALCAVCGAPAIGKICFCFVLEVYHFFCLYIGRNFDAITCLSCKGIYILLSLLLNIHI